MKGQRFGKGDGETIGETAGEARRSMERKMGGIKGKCRGIPTAASAVSSLWIRKGMEEKINKSTGPGGWGRAGRCRGLPVRGLGGLWEESGHAE